MGDFGVKCVASDFTITRGRTLLLILIPSHRNAKERYGIISFDDLTNHPSDGFTAFCLPLAGTYSSYGTIENVDRTPTVEILESYFELTIDQIIQIIGDGSNKSDISDLEITDEKKDILGRLSPCFIIEEVYTRAIELFLKSSSASFLDETPLTPQGLMELGFVRSEESDPEANYRYIRLVNKDNSVYRCEYSPDYLYDFALEGSRIRDITEFRKEFQKTQGEDLFTRYNTDEKKQIAYYFMYRNPVFGECRNPISSKSNLYRMSDSIERMIQNEYMDFYRYVAFYFLMSETNLTLLPKYSGQQYGHPDLELQFAKEKVKIFKKGLHNSLPKPTRKKKK